MKIGIVTGLWLVAESASLVESLRRAAALGFRYVDVQGTLHGSPAQLDMADRQAVKVELATLGLVPRNYILHAPHNPASASEGELEYCYHYLCEGIDMALLWGGQQLMLNPGQWAFGVSREVAWERAVRLLQRLCHYARPRAVQIVLEAEPYVWYMVHDIASTMRMLEDVDRPNIAVLADMGHMALAREGPGDLARLGDSLIHAHLSDHEPSRHTNQVVGTGTTRVGDYFEALRALDIDRRVRRFGHDELVVSIELGAPGDRIVDADGWVRRSLHYLHNVAPGVAQT
jgi:sugar phosphate isomerase/epimerase